MKNKKNSEKKNNEEKTDKEWDTHTNRVRSSRFLSQKNNRMCVKEREKKTTLSLSLSLDHTHYHQT